MADLDTQHKSHGMGLHQEQLAGRTQQVFFSPAAEDNFLYPESFDVDLDNKAEFDAANEKGMTLLIVAATAGHLALVRFLLERGADVEKTNEGGRTPLASAAFGGHVDVIRVLADAGAKLNYVDASGRTALMYAADALRAYDQFSE